MSDAVGTGKRSAAATRAQPRRTALRAQITGRIRLPGEVRCVPSAMQKASIAALGRIALAEDEARVGLAGRAAGAESTAF